MTTCEDCGVERDETCAVWCKCQYCLSVRDHARLIVAAIVQAVYGGPGPMPERHIHQEAK